MMQRNSGGSQRIIILVAVVAVLFVGVLYFMKRVEANRLNGALDALQVERKEKEDQLNGVLTDYQSKIEEMTRQLSDYAARTSKCEDQKATIQVNLEKLESEKADCLNSHETVNREKEQLQAHVTSLTEKHQQVSSQLEAGKNDVRNVQQALNTAEAELEECQDSQEQCNRRATTTSTQLTQCQQQLSACQHQPLTGQRQMPPQYQQGSQLPSLGGHSPISFNPLGNRGGVFDHQQQQLPNLPNPGVGGQFQPNHAFNLPPDQRSLNLPKSQGEEAHTQGEAQEDQDAPPVGQEKGVDGDTVNEDAGEREDKEMLPELIRKADEEEDKGQDRDGKEGDQEKRAILEHYDNEDGDDLVLGGDNKEDAKHVEGDDGDDL